MAKKWYTSKTIWAGVITILVTMYIGLDAGLNESFGKDLPNIPVWIFTALGAMGLYGRTKANTRIE